MAAAHPLLATGPAPEGYAPALATVLEDDFAAHVAGSLVYIDGNRDQDDAGFKRRRTSAFVVAAKDVEPTETGTYKQPAFLIDGTIAGQENAALQTYGVLTVKVNVNGATDLPGPGTVLTYSDTETIGGNAYTTLKEITSNTEHPAAVVVSANWIEGQPQTHCECRVFVSQIYKQAGPSNSKGFFSRLFGGR